MSGAFRESPSTLLPYESLLFRFDDSSNFLSYSKKPIVCLKITFMSSLLLSVYFSEHDPQELLEASELQRGEVRRKVLKPWCLWRSPVVLALTDLLVLLQGPKLMSCVLQTVDKPFHFLFWSSFGIPAIREVSVSFLRQLSPFPIAFTLSTLLGFLWATQRRPSRLTEKVL